MTESSNVEITQLIDLARQGDAVAANRLCEQVFEELRRMAKRIMPQDDTSMQPTMLVNDLWEKLIIKDGLKKTENRRYFYTVAADQMRKLLIDHYRRKKRQKVGGNREREPLDLVLKSAFETFESKSDIDFESLHNALDQLKSQNDRQYEVVMQRYFAGRSIEQTAEFLQISAATVERDWRLARAKLLAQLDEEKE